MAHRPLIFEGGEGAIAPRSYGRLGAKDSGEALSLPGAYFQQP